MLQDSCYDDDIYIRFIAENNLSTYRNSITLNVNEMKNGYEK